MTCDLNLAAGRSFSTASMNMERTNDTAQRRKLYSEARYLGVWSRDEVVRVDLEWGRVLCPGLADGLEGGSPSEPLEGLGEGGGRDKGQDMRLQALQVGGVEHLDGRVLDGAVHPLGLAIRPRVIGPGQFLK